MATFHRCDRCGQEFITGLIESRWLSVRESNGETHELRVISPAGRDYCLGCVRDIFKSGTPVKETRS